MRRFHSSGDENEVETALLANWFDVVVSQNKGTRIWRFPKIRDPCLGGPHNKDYYILGSILGSPNFGKLSYRPQNTIVLIMGTPKTAPLALGNPFLL